MELERRNPPRQGQEPTNRNPNQFGRPFNPQILQTDGRNLEQPIQTPLVINDQIEANLAQLEEETNCFEGQYS